MRALTTLMIALHAFDASWLVQSNGSFGNREGTTIMLKDVTLLSREKASKSYSMKEFNTRPGEELDDGGSIRGALSKVAITPHCIVDIGANKGDWTREMLELYPDAQVIMFEANSEQKMNWADLIGRKNVHVHVGVLSNKKATVDWYKNPSGVGTGDSMFKENTGYYKDIRPIKEHTQTLDEILTNEHPECHVDLIKIDVQGAELLILQAGLRALQQASAVLMEMPFFGMYNKGAPNFAQYIAFMDANGFGPYEIRDQIRLATDENPRTSFVMQVDFLFLKSSQVYE